MPTTATSRSSASEVERLEVGRKGPPARSSALILSSSADLALEAGDVVLVARDVGLQLGDAVQVLLVVRARGPASRARRCCIPSPGRPAAAPRPSSVRPRGSARDRCRAPSACRRRPSANSMAGLPRGCAVAICTALASAPRALDHRDVAAFERLAALGRRCFGSRCSCSRCHAAVDARLRRGVGGHGGDSASGDQKGVFHGFLLSETSGRLASSGKNQALQTFRADQYAQSIHKTK